MNAVPLENVETAFLEARRLAETLGQICMHARGVPKPKAEPETGSLTDNARRLLGRQKRVEQIFSEGGLFGDPAWTIMLELFLSAIDNYNVSVSSACYASGAPPTTALRYIKSLESRGWVEREEDPFDRRRFFLRLSAGGRILVENALK